MLLILQNLPIWQSARNFVSLKSCLCFDPCDFYTHSLGGKLGDRKPEGFDPVT